MRRSFINVVTALVVGTFAYNLAAEEPIETALDNLKLAIDGVVFTNAKDYVAIVGKVGEAEEKIGLGKICDAVDKILDLKAKVEALRDARKAKIQDGAEYTVQDLLEAADTVIAELGGPCL